MKKILAMLLAFTMMIAMAMPAFATGTDGGNGQSSTPATGSITINGVGSGTTYEIYRILDLKSYEKSQDKGTYEYEYNDKWRAFFVSGEGKNYINLDENGVFKWYLADTSDAKIAEFAKKALEYAKTNGIRPEKSSTNQGEFVVTNSKGVFSALPLGYYLIDSTMGALCGLTTTNPNASVNVKNGVPTIDKQVMEDSTNQWGASNTADIGQLVEYRLTINVHAGAENYVVHDVMESGLSFEQNGSPNKIENNAVVHHRGVWQIEHVVPGNPEIRKNVPYNMYTLYVNQNDLKFVPTPENTENPEVPYDPVAVNNNFSDDCKFEIHFTKEFTEHLKTNDKIIIHYNAMLNRYADIASEDTNQSGTELGEGNVNKVGLTFGEGGTATEDTVTTKTYAIDLVKTDGQNSLIDGAKFKIYDGLGENALEVKVVPLMESDDETPILDSNDNPMYRRARADETGEDIIVKDGLVTIVGFDNGKYYLDETKSPDGYSDLLSRQEFIISDSNLDATFNGDVYSTGSGVHVVNHSGQMLPETGGAGTVMFITCGMIVVLGAGVLLVTKKRMNMIK